ELLALRPPFTGETPLSVVYQHVQDISTPPSEASDVSPPELDGLVMRSLANEPDDRFQTAAEMRGLVQYALQLLYDHGGPTGSRTASPRPPRRCAGWSSPRCRCSTTSAATPAPGTPARSTCTTAAAPRRAASPARP